MQRLDFSYNWNNKLDCKAFTTIRLSDRFKLGEVIEIGLNKKLLPGKAKIVGKKYFSLDSLNDFISYLDTGYNQEDCRKIIERMYQNKGVDWATKKLILYLLVWDEE